jgi:hypothetical protein
VIFESIQILYEFDRKIGIISDESASKIIQWTDAVAEIVVVAVDVYLAILFLSIIQFYIKH